MERRILSLALALALALPSAARATSASTSASAATTERKATADYERARRAYFALKADAGRRQFRHHWLAVVERFEAVASAYPGSRKASDALYTSAELLSELSRISMLPEDLQRAVADYRAVLDRHPRDRLADDAALKLARIHAQRLDQPEQAEQILAHAERKLPRGDCSQEIRALRGRLRASLGPLPSPAPAPAPAPSPAASAALPAGPTAPPEPSSPPRPAPTSPSATLEAIAQVARRREAHKPSEAQKPPEEPGSSSTARSSASPSSTDAPRPSEAVSAPRAEKPPAPTAARARAALARLDAGAEKDITIAEQLGLKVRRVVIDAGHGGHDSGAVGRKGVQEKDVALAIALKLGEVLENGGLEVVHTRTTDTYVSLEKRAALANEARGDLFISIHCNSAPSSKQRGVETYSLNIASDRYSIRLAARENSSTEKGISDLQLILADLATKANTEESSRLARQVQRSLAEELSGKYRNVKDLGTKHALFYVLLGAKMPAILVETSFLSNPEEEKQLATSAFQADVASAIASGVGEYVGNRRRLARAGE